MAQQWEVPALRRAPGGPILAQQLPTAEHPFIGITLAIPFALDNARFIAVSIHKWAKFASWTRGHQGVDARQRPKRSVQGLQAVKFC